MKSIFLALFVLVSIKAQAKVSDFNALINENIESQKALHQEVQTQTEITRQALRDGKEAKEVLVVENQGDESINVPTRKDLLRFKKEMVDHRLNTKDLDRRLANEFKKLDSGF